MVFTPTQKLDIGEIVGLTPTLLESYIVRLGASLTAEIETKVLAKVTEWQSGTGNAFTKFTATESNQGLNLDSKDAKRVIIREIKRLLEIDIDSFDGIGSLVIGS